MLVTIRYYKNVVEYENIDGNIGTILEKMGLEVGQLSGYEIPRLENMLKKAHVKSSLDGEQLFYASSDKVAFLGVSGKPEPQFSTLYLFGENLDQHQAAYDFVTYINYLGILEHTIKEIETSVQLNDRGISFVLEDFLVRFGMPFGPAVNIYEQVKIVNDGVTQHTNQAGVLAQLKEIYKEYSGLDYIEGGLN